ncbi:MAG TPA: uroporphyrinogen-III synthase [Chitinophagales bacterium]|nr:uroporphyrinogen-III synthase [Chitinophagales bacterium]
MLKGKTAVKQTSTSAAASSKKTPKPPQPAKEEKPVKVQNKPIIPQKVGERNYEDFLSKTPKTKLKNILISQPQPEGLKSPYFDLAERYKVNIDFQPFIQVEGVPGREFRKQRITLNDFNGIIFTSRNAIDHFFRICEELRVKMSQETKFFCTSEAIALYLQKYTQYRKRKVFYGESQNNNKELRNLLFKHKDTTDFLYICAESRKDEIPSFMKANGFAYAEGVMYKKVAVNLKQFNIEKFDMVLFFSPSGVASLQQNFPKFKTYKIKWGVYGTTTADAIIDAGLELQLMAPLKSQPSIVVALENYLKETSK